MQIPTWSKEVMEFQSLYGAFNNATGHPSRFLLRSYWAWV